MYPVRFGWWRRFTLVAAVGLITIGLRAEEALSLTSPMPYAVFQRSLSNTARIPIAGSAAAFVARLEAKVTLASDYREGTDGHSSEFVEIGRPGGPRFSGFPRDGRRRMVRGHRSGIGGRGGGDW